MLGYNRVIFCGNVTREPELRYTPKGTALCSFGLALNEKYTGADGNKVESVVFIDCTAWEKSAEIIQQYVGKGDPLLVEGKMRQENWEDKQTGQKRTKLSCVVQSFRLLGNGKKAEASAPEADPENPIDPADVPRRTITPAARQPKAPDPLSPPVDDDVPF